MIRLFLVKVAFVLLNLLCFTQAQANTTIDVTVDRLVDADTFDFSGELIPGLVLSGRVRLMCINAAEKSTGAGVALIEHLGTLGIVSGRLEIVDRDVFGRYLAFFFPDGWSISLNQYVFERGAPYYHRLTRAERAACEAILE